MGSFKIRAFERLGNSPPCECSCVVAGDRDEHGSGLNRTG